MVEVTNTGLIEKARTLLGLRGKAVVTSRNSIYPVVVVNADNQPITMAPSKMPPSATRIIRTYTAMTAGAWVTLYTVPAGKVAFFIFTSQFQNTAAIQSQLIACEVGGSAGTAGNTILHNMATAGFTSNSYAVAIKLTAGEFLTHYVGATGVGGTSILGWEEDA